MIWYSHFVHVIYFNAKTTVQHEFNNCYPGDPWVAQQFSTCLRPREWSWSPGMEPRDWAPGWSPGMESHIELPAWSLSFNIWSVEDIPILNLCITWSENGRGQSRNDWNGISCQLIAALSCSIAFKQNKEMWYLTPRVVRFSLPFISPPLHL